MLERAYIEIGNVCNLSCSFCPKTHRAPRIMSPSEFETVLHRISGEVRFVYLHVMGEPLMHPELPSLLELLRCFGMRACITTNGTLLDKAGGLLLGYSDVIHKVSVSLHAPEGNGREESCFDGYLGSVCRFAKAAGEVGIYSVLRLWNMDSADAEGKNIYNPKIEKYLRGFFSGEWQKRTRGIRLSRNVFLEYDGVFVWPSLSDAEENERLYCHALSSQIAILSDGTVVPCCLDNEGDMPLGNIFEQSLDKILDSERAVRIKKGFQQKLATETLCKSCTYARRFKV